MRLLPLIALALAGCVDSHRVYSVPDTNGVFHTTCDLPGEPESTRYVHFPEDTVTMVISGCRVEVIWDGLDTFEILPTFCEGLTPVSGTGEIVGDELVLDLELDDGRVLHCEGSR